MYDLLLNTNFHLALAVAASVAAAYCWGHVIGHRKGMREERVRFLSSLIREMAEELTQTKNKNQEQDNG